MACKMYSYKDDLTFVGDILFVIKYLQYLNMSLPTI